MAIKADVISRLSERRIPLAMYGVLLGCLGIAMYLFGVFLALPRQAPSQCRFIFAEYPDAGESDGV
jgi:hypothetical protein